MSSESHRTPSGNQMTTHDSTSRVEAALDDLRAASAALRNLGAQLVAHQGTVTAIGWHLPAAGDIASPITAFECSQHLLSLTLGQHALGRRGGRALILSAKVSATVVAYEAAEDAADLAMGEVRKTIAIGRLAVAVGYGLHHFQTSGDGGAALTDTLEHFPDAARGAGALADRLGGGLGFAAMTKLLGALGNSQATHSGPVVITERGGPGSSTSPPPARSIGDAARRIDELHRNGSQAAHIQAQRVVDATGRGRWVVLVPGTQDFAANRPNPADGTGNLQSIAGHPSAMSGAVRSALEAAQRSEGVYGKREPVLLVGHSQGGMVASNLGRDAATRQQFNITNVATFGSPVGHLRPGVDELNVANTRDLVPALNGTHTGDGDERRVTLRIGDRSSMTNGDGKREFSGAHDAKNYGADYTDALSTASDGSGLRHFDSSTRPHFDGPARTYLYDAQRQPQAGGAR